MDKCLKTPKRNRKRIVRIMSAECFNTVKLFDVVVADFAADPLRSRDGRKWGRGDATHGYLKTRPCFARLV